MDIQKLVAPEIESLLLDRDILPEGISPQMASLLRDYDEAQNNVDKMQLSLKDKYPTFGSLKGAEIIPHVNPEDAGPWRKLLEDFFNTHQALKNACCTSEALKNYVKNCLAIPGFMLGYLQSDGEHHPTSSMDALAKLNNHNVRVWIKNGETLELEVVHSYESSPSAPWFDLHHTWGLTHFNVLHKEPGLVAAPIIHAEDIKDTHKGFTAGMQGDLSGYLGKTTEKEVSKSSSLKGMMTGKYRSHDKECLNKATISATIEIQTGSSVSGINRSEVTQETTKDKKSSIGGGVFFMSAGKMQETSSPKPQFSLQPVEEQPFEPNRRTSHEQDAKRQKAEAEAKKLKQQILAEERVPLDHPLRVENAEMIKNLKAALAREDKKAKSPGLFERTLDFFISPTYASEVPVLNNKKEENRDPYPLNQVAVNGNLMDRLISIQTQLRPSYSVFDKLAGLSQDQTDLAPRMTIPIYNVRGLGAEEGIPDLGLRHSIDRAIFEPIRSGISQVNQMMERGARVCDMMEAKYGPSRLRPGSQHLGVAAVKVVTSFIPDSDVQLGIDLAGGAAFKVVPKVIKWGRGLYHDYQVPLSLGADPFNGRTFVQIAKRLENKGYIMRGINPAEGKGSYHHPVSNRKYFLDKGGPYKKGYEYPHVDVHRKDPVTGKIIEGYEDMPKNFKLKYPKKKYPLGEKLNEKLQDFSSYNAHNQIRPSRKK